MSTVCNVYVVNVLGVSVLLTLPGTSATSQLGPIAPVKLFPQLVLLYVVPDILFKGQLASSALPAD